MAEAAGKGLVSAEVDAISELKKELQKAVEALVEEDEDDCGLETADSAIRTLCALKDLKLKRSDKEYVKLGNLGFQEPPPEFRCPISGILMRDPVVVASGQTYEEQYIRQWLEDGNWTCPQTDQVLPHSALICNHLVKKMIMDWCKEHQVDMPRTGITDDDDQEEEFTANVTEEDLMEMLRTLSSKSLSSKSIIEQREVGRKLRSLTYKLPSVRALFGQIPGSLPLLLQSVIHHDLDLLEDLLATISNIFSDENNMEKMVAEYRTAFLIFVDFLTSKEVKLRIHATAILYALSKVDSTKQFIGESGAIRALVELMEEGHLFAVKDAALAILNLCTVIENRERAISDGAVVAVSGKIKGHILIDEMLDILAMLSRHQKAIDEMEEQGMLQCLFDIINESTTSEQNKEHCVAVVHAMCFSSRAILRKVDRVQNGYETLAQVARTGTSRAKRKASSILDRLSKIVFFPHIS